MNGYNLKSVKDGETPHAIETGPVTVLTGSDESPDITAAGSKKTVVVLHGFDLCNNHQPLLGMAEFVETLRGVFEPHGINVYTPTYDTHESFVKKATHLVSDLKTVNVDESGLYMFGYSMGGLVARQMIAAGLRPHHLSTWCTPHKGILKNGLDLFPNKGVLSMRHDSEDLYNLNQNGTERARRGRVAALAVTYKKNGVDQKNDGNVSVFSANGAGLGFGTHGLYAVPGKVSSNPAQSPHARAQFRNEIDQVMDGFIRTVFYH